MASRAKKQLIEMIEAMTNMEAKELIATIEQMNEEDNDDGDEEPREVRVRVAKAPKAEKAERATRTPRKAKAEAVNIAEMSKAEQNALLAKLQVRKADAGPNVATFLKKVFKLSTAHTERQLVKLGKEKGVDFHFGKGRQTPEGKKQKMAAQILSA